MSDEALRELISRLTKRLDRVPTEDEVTQFIFGSLEEKTAIWNGKGVSN